MTDDPEISNSWPGQYA